jgi:hypothetical protein
MRGTANGEPIVSQAQTKEYDEGYERTFGDRKPVRGRWVYDPAQQKLVPADEYQAADPEVAANAGILSGRFYENTRATDGADIGSRKKHRDYMRAHGLAPADDFSPGYYEKLRRNRELEARKAKRERIERKFWEIQNDRSKKGL